MRNHISYITRAFLGLIPIQLFAVVETRNSRWYIEAGPSIWLNSTIIFGAKANNKADPSLAPKSERYYDDGYNRVDASGNLGDGTGGTLPSRTGYFGFTNNNQVDLKAGVLSMHRSEAAEGAYQNVTSSAKQPSWQGTLRLVLGGETNGSREWGIEAGIDVTRHSFVSRENQPITVRVLTDQYQLGGVVPQPAIYQGAFSPTPGSQRIGDLPTRSINLRRGTVMGSRSISGNTQIVRLGGWWEILPPTQIPTDGNQSRWSLLARGGPALVLNKFNIQIQENISTPELGTSDRYSSSASQTSTHLGFYAGASLHFTLSSRWSLLARADYLQGPKLSIAVGELRSFTINQTQTIIFNLRLQRALGHR